MSSVTSSAPLSLIWRGTWQASGVNSNGYQRYDCVSHAVTSPTARTDIYFAVTEIASGGAEPNPTSGQTTWKLLLEGGSVGAANGSLVFHNADGENEILMASSDRIVEIVNGVPAFVNRPADNSEIFVGYSHPETPLNGNVPTSSTFWLSGNRVYGMGVFSEGYASQNLDYDNVTYRQTLGPAIFIPSGDDAQENMGKIFHGYRCVFAISRDNTRKVYALGLNAGRFGDGMDTTNLAGTFVYDHFQKIDYFEDNSVNVASIVTPYIGGYESFTTRDTDGSDNSQRIRSAIAYFIEEIVETGAIDTGGRVYFSAGSVTRSSLAGGLAQDGEVRQLTGFDQPIIGGLCRHDAAFFWSKRKVYAIGNIITAQGGNPANTATVTELTTAGSFTDATQVGFLSDIVHFYANQDEISATITLADGTAFYYNYKAPRGTRTTSLFEQLPVISGKLYSKVGCLLNGEVIVALMDDNTIYLEGVYHDGNTARTSTGLNEIELPLGLQARDFVLDVFNALHIITTDGNLVTAKTTGNNSLIRADVYKMDVTFPAGNGDGHNITLYTDPGWTGHANSVVFYTGSDSPVISIATEEGYIYNSNTIGIGSSTSTDNSNNVVVNGRRNIGINMQYQYLYSSTGALLTANGNSAGNGLFSANPAIVVNGSMVQRPTLRSYQVT